MTWVVVFDSTHILDQWIYRDIQKFLDLWEENDQERGRELSPGYRICLEHGEDRIFVNACQSQVLISTEFLLWSRLFEKVYAQQSIDGKAPRKWYVSMASRGMWLLAIGQFETLKIYQRKVDSPLFPFLKIEIILKPLTRNLKSRDFSKSQISVPCYRWLK